MRRRRINSAAAWLTVSTAVLGIGLAVSSGCRDRGAAEPNPAEQSQADSPATSSRAALATQESPAADTELARPEAAQREEFAAEPPSLTVAPATSQSPPSAPARASAPDQPDLATSSSQPNASQPNASQPNASQPNESQRTAAGSADSLDMAELATNRLQLRTDLSPERLVDFLRSVDLEMQSVATGRKGLFDVDEANAELVRLSKLKLQAAEQLETRAEAQPAQQATAIRGKLQALSHLAALGDLPAAEQLEAFAGQHADSQHPGVALDSRLVLIGLAMERLQNGAADSAEELLGLIDQIASSAEPPDVSALMVMGQARAVLQQYGYHQAAEQVRAAIVDLFANHPNPEVGAMAIQLVGSASYTQLSDLLRSFERRESLPVDQWKAAAESLVKESADMAAVQFLASAALQFEAFNSDELADATFEVLQGSDRFSEAEAAEIAVAAEARQTRREIIGKPFDFDLPSVDGRPLSIAAYSGKVVLMPFWAVAFPDSLRVLQTLAQVREQFSGQVEIIGMNLDPADAPADEFLRQSPVEFRSFESVSPPGGEANPMAARFGVASLPFVAVIAPDGTVAAINLTGQGLESQVQKLLATE